MDLAQLTDDLIAEQAALDEVCAGLDDDQWALPTPSDGWSVADQIAHLTYFDRAAQRAIADHEGFQALLRQALALVAAHPAIRR